MLRLHVERRSGPAWHLPIVAKSGLFQARNRLDATGWVGHSPAPKPPGAPAGACVSLEQWPAMRLPIRPFTSFASHAIVAVIVAVLVGLPGCSTAPQGGDAAASAQRTVVNFLEAIRRGDDSVARGLLSVAARTKTEEMGLSVAPPVEDTATYTIKASEVVSEDGDVVHVGTTWTDTDADGFKTSDNVVWVVRLDPEGWRVVGMAMRIFEDLPPLLLNFEDPEDMLAKQEMVAFELQKRAAAGESAAEEPRTAGNPPAKENAGPR